MLKTSHFHERGQELLTTKLAELEYLGSHPIHIIIHMKEKGCI